MSVVIVPPVIEEHRASAVQPMKCSTAGAFCAACVVLGSVIGDGFTRYLSTRAHREANRSCALHETASTIDAALLPRTIDITVLLVEGRLIGVEVQLYRGDAVLPCLFGVLYKSPNTLSSILVFRISLQKIDNG